MLVTPGSERVNTFSNKCSLQDCEEVFRFYETEYAKMLERWEKVTNLIQSTKNLTEQGKTIISMFSDTLFYSQSFEILNFSVYKITEILRML